MTTQAVEVLLDRSRRGRPSRLTSPLVQPTATGARRPCHSIPFHNRARTENPVTARFFLKKGWKYSFFWKVFDRIHPFVNIPTA